MQVFIVRGIYWIGPHCRALGIQQKGCLHTSRSDSGLSFLPRKQGAHQAQSHTERLVAPCTVHSERSKDLESGVSNDRHEYSGRKDLPAVIR